MTGRQKIEAAFSPQGTPEVAAVICYEGIYIRDHWSQLTDHPWWYQFAPDLERQLAWRRDVIARTGQDWFALPGFLPRQRRENLDIEERPDGVYRVDKATGAAELLEEPQIGGWTAHGETQSVVPMALAEQTDEIDVVIPIPPEPNLEAARTQGRHDLAAALLDEYGRDLWPICHVASPLWNTYNLWGFEGMMTMVAQRPDLVHYACGRYLTLAKRGVRQAAALGAAGIWIEDCMTDMVSPRAFADLHVPYLQQIVEEIRAAGMKSIHYFCGNPAGKWDLLLATGADALSLEEGKKGFEIDIEDMARRVRGRCAILGNLDAVAVLEQGSDAQLRAEVTRQVGAGRANGSRFVMSIGSPVTPDTPVSRVRRYCDLVHEIGR